MTLNTHIKYSLQKYYSFDERQLFLDVMANERRDSRHF